MQPTKAGGVGCRPRPGLRPATTDHWFSEGRLQLISHSLDSAPPSRLESIIADRSGTSIVPLLKDDYLACWIAPAGAVGAWPSSLTIRYPHAVVLEAEPDGGPDRWRYTKAQAWPED